MGRIDDCEGNRAPVAEALKLYASEVKYRLHVPAHGGNKIDELSMSDSFIFDGTEIAGLDDLFDPTGAIKEAQDLAATAYGALHAIFCTCGSSVALIAAILAACKSGRMIVPRDCHPSIINATIIAGLTPAFVAVNLSDTGLSLGPCDVSVSKAFADAGPETPLLLINPSYYGLSPLAPEWYFKRLVIADEAHGAHFPFLPKLPDSLSASGAELVIAGMHKTGGALTQASVIRIHGQNIAVEALVSCLRLVHTSSPSYPIMASIDMARRWLSVTGKQQLDEACSIALELIYKLETKFGIYCPGKALAAEGRIGGYDPFRLVVPLPQYDVRWICEQLRVRYGIQLEFEDGKHLVGVLNLSPNKSVVQKFVTSLDKLLVEAPPPAESIGEAHDKLGTLLCCDTEFGLPPREAYFSQTKLAVPWYKAAGKIAAETVAMYPPGVCIVVPGQIITSKAVETAVSLLKARRRIQSTQGINAETVTVVGGKNE